MHVRAHVAVQSRGCMRRAAPLRCQLPVRNGNGALRANINAAICILNELRPVAEIFDRAKEPPAKRTSKRERKSARARARERKRAGDRRSLSTVYLHFHVISRD